MNIINWMMLQRIFGYGTKRVEVLLEMYGHPDELFNRPVSEITSRLSLAPKELEMLVRRKETESEIYRYIDVAERVGATILTPDSEKYPERLRHIYGKPVVLYVLGNVDALNHERMIAMVGTRNVTQYGSDVGTELSRQLVDYGFTVVSGLARGVDTIAHKGTLHADGCTVAVVGTGIDRVYPSSNRALQNEILGTGGAIVTEFPPMSEALPFHFPLRNRIISGLSLGVIVVEGARGSGSLITAGHAIAQNREVFAVPGEIYSRLSQATNWLIRQGAVMTTCAEDVCEQFPYMSFEWQDKKSRAPKVKSTTERETPQKTKRDVQNKQQQLEFVEPPHFLDEEQHKIWSQLSYDEISADDIFANSGVGLPKILATLTQLELFDIVVTCPGRRYKLK